jgi:hypothetical protein
MKSTTYLCFQQFSRDTKQQVMTPNNLSAHPLVTQLVGHFWSKVVVNSARIIHGQASDRHREIH